MITEVIKVPDIGVTEGVAVIEVCVAERDQVLEGDSLVLLESDKASIEVPSPMAGTVKVVSISVGDVLLEGDAILELDTDDISAGASFTAQPVGKSSTSLPSC